MSDFDLIIIGAGPGGYVAAIRAAQLGLKTALVEKSPTLGGTCLNVGCIPSKSLLESSHLYTHVKNNGKEHGIILNELSFNFSKIMERKSQVVDSLTKGVAGLIQKNKIERFEGVASFTSPTSIDLNGQSLQAKYFILATGSNSIELPFLPYDESRVVSSTGALSLDKIPEQMVVMGAGVIGVELASVYSRLGSEVTLIEMLDQICYPLDHTIAKSFQQILKKQGLNFHLNTKVTKADLSGKQVILNTDNQEFKADVVLVSVGRKPYIDGLNLEKIGITPDKRGMVSVNNNFQTALSHIYAIGDLIDGPMLAHKASEEGIAAAEIIAGESAHINYMAIPSVIYTHPEVASVGLSEKEAEEMGISPIVGTYLFRGNARARCAGEMEGLVKIIGDQKTDQLVGIHIVGSHASEMIGEGVLAIEKRATVTDIATASHAHPTLSEAIKEAALNALGRTIHY